MKKCLKCGKESEDNAKYCSECGTDLSQKPIESKENEIKNNAKRKKGNASGVIIVLLTIFFLFASIGTVVLGTVYLVGKLDIRNIPNRMMDNMMGTNNYGILVRSSSQEFIYLSGEELNSGLQETMESDLDSDGTMEAFALRKDDTGTIVNLYSGSSKKAINVFEDNINTDNSLNEDGELKGEYGIQITVRDLDRDGIGEVLVAIGNDMDDMKLTIYSYEDGTFTNKGSIDGENIISIGTFDNIKVQSYVSPKLNSIYRYENGKIVEISKDGLSPKLKNKVTNKIVSKLESDGNSEVTFLGGEKEVSFVMNNPALDYLQNNGTVSEDFIKYCRDTAKDNGIEYMEVLMKDENGDYELVLEIENNKIKYIYNERDKGNSF